MRNLTINKEYQCTKTSMSLLRKSETKHVVTKTLRETNTPPKYLQSMSSSKGVRSTSYVHRTFVDAEAKVEPDDVRLDITNNKLRDLLKKLKKNTKGDKGALQRRIVQLLGNNFNATNLPGAFSNLQYIYKFVSGKSTTERNPNILKEMISLEIKGPPKTKIDNFVNQTPAATNTQQNDTNTAKITKAAPTEEEKQKKKFNDFWEIVKDMNKKDINNKLLSLKESQKYVKNMLKELQKLLDKSGPYVPSFKARGDFLAGVADKNSNKTLTEDEIRKIITNTPKLKELFSIGKTGDFDKNMDPLVSWRTSRERIDTDEDGRYTLEEFAQYYLAAVLKKKGRDQLTGTYYEADTFDTMLKLFGIGDEKEEDENGGETKKDSPEPKQDSSGGETKEAHPYAKTRKGTKVWYEGEEYTLRDLNKDETKWSLTDGDNKRFKRGKGFDFVDISLIPPPVKKVPPPKPTIMDEFLKQKEDIDNEKVPVVPPPAPQTTSPTLKVGDIVKNLSTKGRNVDSLGIITEMKKEKADVTWQDGNQTNNKKLTDLKLVTIDPATEKKIKDIFDFYDTKRKDGNLDNVESLKFLRENLKRISQVFSKKELFSQPDGKSGISFEEFRFMLTVIPDTIAKFEKEVEKEEAKSEPQRKRQSDPDKVKQKQEQEAAAIKIQAALRTRQQKEQARQKQEQARQAALDRQEQARQAALDRQKETEKAVKENQKRIEEEETKRIADDKKIIVEKKDGKYFVRQTKAYKDYKEKLEGPDGIPETACKPETTTNN